MSELELFFSFLGKVFPLHLNQFSLNYEESRKKVSFFPHFFLTCFFGWNLKVGGFLGIEEDRLTLKWEDGTPITPNMEELSRLGALTSLTFPAQKIPFSQV